MEREENHNLNLYLACGIGLFLSIAMFYTWKIEYLTSKRLLKSQDVSLLSMEDIFYLAVGFVFFSGILYLLFHKVIAHMIFRGGVK